MKKLIMTIALFLTVLPTFAAVGQQSDTNCAAISGATHEESQVQDVVDDKSGSEAIDG